MLQKEKSGNPAPRAAESADENAVFTPEKN
jgi:hypothetical protein